MVQEYSLWDDKALHQVISGLESRKIHLDKMLQRNRELNLGKDRDKSVFQESIRSITNSIYSNLLTNRYGYNRFLKFFQTDFGKELSSKFSLVLDDIERLFPGKVKRGRTWFGVTVRRGKIPIDTVLGRFMMTRKEYFSFYYFEAIKKNGQDACAIRFSKVKIFLDGIIGLVEKLNAFAFSKGITLYLKFPSTFREFVDHVDTLVVHYSGSEGDLGEEVRNIVVEHYKNLGLDLVRELRSGAGFDLAIKEGDSYSHGQVVAHMIALDYVLSTPRYWKDKRKMEIWLLDKLNYYQSMNPQNVVALLNREENKVDSFLR